MADQKISELASMTGAQIDASADLFAIVDTSANITKNTTPDAVKTALGLDTTETTANKSTSVTTDQASNTKYPSVKSVYDWVISLGYQASLTASNFGAFINGLTGKNTPVNTDYDLIMDSEDSNKVKKVSYANRKAELKTYFDTLYANNTLANLTISGNRRPSKLSVNNSANTVNTAGRYLCWKVTPAKSFTCTALGCIHNGSAAGSFFRIGLYTNSADGFKPGTLLEETGSLSVATSGLKEGTINQYIDSSLTYWIVIQVSSTSVSLPYMNQTENDIIDPITGQAWCGATAVAAYGALPADFSAITLGYGRPATAYAYEVTMKVA